MYIFWPARYSIWVGCITKVGTNRGFNWICQESWNGNELVSVWHFNISSLLTKVLKRTNILMVLFQSNTWFFNMSFKFLMRTRTFAECLHDFVSILIMIWYNLDDINMPNVLFVGLIDLTTMLGGFNGREWNGNILATGLLYSWPVR